MADQKVKKYSPAAMAGDARSADELLVRFRRAKEDAAVAKAKADDLRDQVLARCWSDDLAPLLQAGGYDGLEIMYSDGRPAVRVAMSFPVRFQGKELERDDPQLYARYKRQADQPEVRVTVVGDGSDG